jgi:hypothetical protein
MISALDFPSLVRRPAVTEKVSTLDRGEHTASSNLAVRDLAFIEPDRDEPRVVWRSQRHLLYCYRQLFVLVAFTTGNAIPGEAGYKHKSIIRDRAADFHAPVFTGP